MYPRSALAKCDADALVDGYTDDATVFFPDGVVVQGRKALQKLYDGFVKSPVTAPFLAKPYFSTDGYVFKGEKIAAEMSTFDATRLVFKN